MSVKSKARRMRRAKHENVSAEHVTPHVPVKVEERRAAGAIMGALLEAITFGTLEAAPESRA
jgi:hypothetical protein